MRKIPERNSTNKDAERRRIDRGSVILDSVVFILLALDASSEVEEMSAMIGGIVATLGILSRH